MFKYILHGRDPVPCDDIIAWGRFFEKVGNRIVARTQVGAVSEVSTVFLGMDHNFGGGPPVLFETMVFGGPMEGEQERYHTWEQAEEGHAWMVARVTAAHVAAGLTS